VGAACCDIFRPDRDVERTREVVGVHAKAAPLQWDTNTSSEHANLFGYEDDETGVADSFQTLNLWLLFR